MALSYFSETFIGNTEFEINHFRVKKIKDRFLLTTDHGSWIVLDKKEYDSLISKRLDDSLFKTLEEKGIILTEYNSEKILHEYKSRYNFLFSGVALHIIVPTLRCNHRCVYCHSSAHDPSDISSDMDEETLKKTIEFIFQTPAESIRIEFQGGDLLLNKPLLKKAVEYSKELNKVFLKEVKFSLVTNLTLMDKDILEYIIHNNISLCTSVDGPEHLHNKNRKYTSGKDTYQDVMGWARRIAKEYDYPVGALMVTTKESLKYPKEIVDEYAWMGIRNLQIKYINCLGFAQEGWDEIGYTAEEFIDFWKKCADYMIELNKKGVKIQPRYATIILQKILNHQDPSFLDLRSPCGIAAGQLAYNCNGDIYACDEGRNYDLFRLGNVKKDKYKDVISAEKAQNLISSSMLDNLLCDSCAYKPYCGTCPVINYAETGSILPKLNQSSKCRIHKAMFDYVFEKLISDEETREIFFDWCDNWKNNRHLNFIRKKSKDEFLTLKYFIEHQSDLREVRFIKKLNSAGEVYLVETHEGKKIAKISRSIQAHQILQSALCLFLKEKGYKVIFPAKNIFGKEWIDAGDLKISVYDYVESDKYSFSQEEVKSAAKELAEFHNLLKGYNPRRKFYFSKKYKQIVEDVAKIEKCEYQGLIGEAKQIIDAEGIQKGWIHGDWTPSNLLFSGKRVKKVLDFECAGVGPLIFDIATAAYFFSAAKEGMHPALFKLFIEEYSKVNTITEKERSLIMPALKCKLLEMIYVDYPNKSSPEKMAEYLKKIEGPK